jgi:ATP-dependent helicase/nuclease subunit A
MLAMADRVPPYEFYAAALTVHDMRRRLLKRLGHEAADAIDEFLGLSFAHEAGNTPSLEGFLHWIEQGGAEIKRDMDRGRDEVRVMTVHGAKGLEADIVILPDTARTPVARSGGGFLYTEDSLLFPIANELAPRAVLAAKEAATARTMEEYRRLFYVALTRARDRLIICGFENKRKSSGITWHELAERAVREIGASIVREGETIHVIGDAEDRATAPSDAEAKTVVAEPDWLRKPAPRDAPLPRLIRPFDAAGLNEPAFLPVSAQELRFRRGLLVHALLSHLPEVPTAARRARAQRFLDLQNLTAAESEALARETFAVLDDPRFAAAFAPDSRAEVAIVADLPELGPGARVNGRVDRLAIAGDTVTVIDFKTNRPPPARQEDVATLYRTQMALYRAAAQKIFPGKRIVCGLVWTEGPTLMELSNALLDEELGRIRTRLDPSSERS